MRDEEQVCTGGNHTHSTQTQSGTNGCGCVISLIQDDKVSVCFSVETVNKCWMTVT